MKESIFNPKLSNNVSRNGFDISRRMITTLKAGMLLPTYSSEVVPGDKFNINLDSFARTMPLQNAAFTRIRMYHEFFFVPYRLLWRFFPQYVVQRGDGVTSAISNQASPFTKDTTQWNIPYISSKKLYSLAQLGLAQLSLRKLSPNVDSIYTPSPAGRDRLYDEFGFCRKANSVRLLSQLGYYNVVSFGSVDHIPSTGGSDVTNYIAGSWGTGVNSNRRVSAFPLLAYQKIYSDFFRNNQWEASEPWTFNADYVRPDVNDTSNDLGVIQTSNFKPKDTISVEQCVGSETCNGAWSSPSANLFDLRYCDFNRDFILGAFPDSQFGARASVDVLFPQNFQLQAQNSISTGSSIIGIGQRDRPNGNVIQQEESPYPTLDFMIVDNSSEHNPVLSTSFNVLSLRYAQALQKYREISLSNDADYKSQIEAHFGVKVPSMLSNSAIYLGGSHQSINFSTIANNNLTENQEATLQSIGTSNGNSKIQFEAKEHGIVMCITYIKPLPEYAPLGFEPTCTHLETDDFMIPEFDKIGQEKVDNFMICGGTEDTMTLFGSRYYDYKSTYDVVLGNLNQRFGGDMPDYSMQLNWKNFSLFSDAIVQGGAAAALGYYCFKVNPTVLDSIFFAKANDSWSSDQFILCDDYTVTVLRNLDRKGMPY